MKVLDSNLLRSTTRRSAFALVAMAAVLSTACAVGPDYEPPELDTPNAFHRADAVDPTGAAGEAAAVPEGWWSSFGDPVLDQLVVAAMAENSDLRIALARVDEVRALLGVTRSFQYPEVGVAGLGARGRLSERANQVLPGQDPETEIARAVVTFDFEIDLWGRLRRLTEAAEADLLATEYGADAARLSLQAAVARAYFNLRSLDRQLTVARDTQTSRSEVLELQQFRFDNGVISELELAQAKGELALARAVVPDLEFAVQQAESRLSLLIGRNSAPITRGLELEQLTTPPPVPTGLPSALLERRPDLAAAEQLMVAANARIGVAKAAYFPTLSLTADAGSASAELSGLFASNSSIWNVAANLIGPLFNAGRTKRQVEAARAREVQAIESYRQTVRAAFADVEDALVARRVSETRRVALVDQQDALETAYELARLRYEAGSSSYFEVLDAQRSLFRAQLELAAGRDAEFVAAVALFQALGGGWVRPE